MQVTMIDVGENQLTGPLPASINSTLFLRDLSLDHNNFTGPVVVPIVRWLLGL